MKPTLAYPNKMLNHLYLQAKGQLVLLAEIKAVLPVEISEHTLHCVISKKTLLVYTDSANSATRLRFYGDTILTAAKRYAGAGRLSILRVKVLPAFEPRNQKRKPYHPSFATAKALQAYSQAIHDPMLRAALERLSSTLTRLQAEND